MAQAQLPKKLTFENCRIIYRNFAGKEKQFNAAGDRNFCLLLEDHDAKNLAEMGFNIKFLKPREEEDDPKPYIPVKVKYSKKEGAIPPRVVLVTSRGRTNLEESDVNIIDFAEIVNVDLIIRPFAYDFNGRKGVNAYLNAIYVTIKEDALEAKYADVPDTQSRQEAPEDAWA